MKLFATNKENKESQRHEVNILRETPLSVGALKLDRSDVLLFVYDSSACLFHTFCISSGC